MASRISEVKHKVESVMLSGRTAPDQGSALALGSATGLGLAGSPGPCAYSAVSAASDISINAAGRDAKTTGEFRDRERFFAIQNAPILNLVFEGGGAKGGAYGGAIEALELLEIMDGVQNIAGSSAGGITAFLLAIGFRSKQIQEIITNLNFEQLLDNNSIEPDWRKMSWMELIRTAAAVWRGNGLCEGKEFLKMIGDFLISQNLPPNLTFRQLHELVMPGSLFKNLYLTATNYNTNKPQVFSWQETPDVCVADAVRATMSFPFAFKPHKIKIGNIEYEFGDGWIKNNYPMEIFDDPQFLAENCEMLTIKRTSSLAPYNTQVNPCTLGFRVDSLDECASILWRAGGDIDVKSAGEVIGIADIGKALLVNEDDKLYARYFFNTVQIPTAILTLQFKLNQIEKAEMLGSGKNTTLDYFRLYRNRIPREVAISRQISPHSAAMGVTAYSADRNGTTLNGGKVWETFHEDWEFLVAEADAAHHKAAKVGPPREEKSWNEEERIARLLALEKGLRPEELKTRREMNGAGSFCAAGAAIKDSASAAKSSLKDTALLEAQNTALLLAEKIRRLEEELRRAENVRKLAEARFENLRVEAQRRETELLAAQRIMEEKLRKMQDETEQREIDGRRAAVGIQHEMQRQEEQRREEAKQREEDKRNAEERMNLIRNFIPIPLAEGGAAEAEAAVREAVPAGVVHGAGAAPDAVPAAIPAPAAGAGAVGLDPADPAPAPIQVAAVVLTQPLTQAPASIFRRGR